MDSRKNEFIDDLCEHNLKKYKQRSFWKEVISLIRYPKLFLIVGFSVILSAIKSLFGISRHSSFSVRCEMWLSALESSTNYLPILGFSMSEIRWLQDISSFPPRAKDQTVTKVDLGKVGGSFVTHSSIPQSALMETSINYTSVKTTEKVVFFLHGGGFCVGNFASYAKQLSIVSEITQLTHFFLEYSLSPERPYPIPLDETVHAFKALYSVFGNRLVLCGDSAGGNLCLSLLLSLQECGHPLPHKAVLISPWTDLSWASSAFDEGCAGIAMDFVRNYVSHEFDVSLEQQRPFVPLDLQSPKISPVYGDYQQLAGKVEFLCFSGHEPIAADIARWVQRAKKSGVKVHNVICDHLPHTYPLLCLGVHHEADKSIHHISNFYSA